MALVAIRGSWSDTPCARAVRARDRGRQLRDVIGPVRANIHRSSEEGARWDVVDLLARRHSGSLIAVDFTRGARMVERCVFSAKDRIYRWSFSGCVCVVPR